MCTERPLFAIRNYTLKNVYTQVDQCLKKVCPAIREAISKMDFVAKEKRGAWIITLISGSKETPSPTREGQMSP